MRTAYAGCLGVALSVGLAGCVPEATPPSKEKVAAVLADLQVHQLALEVTQARLGSCDDPAEQERLLNKRWALRKVIRAEEQALDEVQKVLAEQLADKEKKVDAIVKDLERKRKEVEADRVLYELADH
jgi:hypothetical protein